MNMIHVRDYAPPIYNTKTVIRRRLSLLSVHDGSSTKDASVCSLCCRFLWPAPMFLAVAVTAQRDPSFWVCRIS